MGDMMDTDTEEIVRDWDLDTLQRWHFNGTGGDVFLAWMKRRLGVEADAKAHITAVSRHGDRISVTRYEQPYRVVRCGDGGYAHAAKYVQYFDLEGDEPSVWPPEPACPGCGVAQSEHSESCN